MKLSLKSYTTEELVRELIERTGVDYLEVGDNDIYEVSTKLEGVVWEERGEVILLAVDKGRK